MTHTATPWKLGTRFPCRIMSDKTGNHSNLVASTCLHSDEGTETQEEKANAEFICLAVNSHAALVEALEGLLHDPMAERTVDAAKKALALATGQPEKGEGR